MGFQALLVFLLSLGLKEIKGDCSGHKLDVAVLGDRSRSLKPADLQKLRRAVYNITDVFGVSPDGNHFGFISFGPRAVLYNTFSNSNYQNLVALNNLVDKKFQKIRKNWGTRIDKGEQLALNTLFTNAGGDRPDATNVMLIFTDGKATGHEKSDFTPLNQLTDGLEGKGVQIIAVGIGRNINRTNMNTIAGTKGEVIINKDFETMLAKIQQSIDTACAIDGGYTNWTFSECSVTCGGGTETLTRTCTNPPPSNGGKDCRGLGPASLIRECNTQHCPPPCTAGLDIGIVLDKSKSVKLPNLKKVIEFLKSLINKFNPAPDADHFGLITFHNKATMAFNFANSALHERNALLSKIAKEPLKLEWKTRTDLALEMARDKLFTEIGGDRPDKPNVMIVLTDGKPTDLTRDQFRKFAEGISKEFKEKHVNTVAVGIGPRVNRDVLQQIAGAGNPVVQVQGFSQLQNMIDTIKASACSE